MQLAEAFCDALANLLDSPKNRERFGNRRVLIILKTYLQTNNQALQRSLTKAIDDLSQIPSNCVVLHDVGITSVRLLSDQSSLEDVSRGLESPRIDWQ